MKKVLHIRLDAPQYSSDGIKKGFIENGYEYHGINWQALKFDVGIIGLQARVLQAAKEIESDLIFLHIQGPGVLDIEFCQELSECGTTVLYTFDVREDIKWQQELAPYLDLILFADKGSVDQCNEIGIFNVDVLQSSCDMDIYKPREPKVKYPQSIAFIGSNYVNTNLNFPMAQERLDMVNFLRAEYGHDFLVKGMNWPISEFVNVDQEVDIYNSVKIAICQNNFDRELYFSDRVWRAMACGCLVLHKHVVGAKEIFDPTNMNIWISLNDLKTKIDFYLSDIVARKRISENGCDLVRTRHNWAERIKELENIIKKHGEPTASRKVS